MLQIDGTYGEGGGQILRSSLALAVATGQPFAIERIRGKRARPGLQRQHLTCVDAARRISQARVAGAELGSQALRFEPTAVGPGEYEFDIGSAGSTMMVLQAVLPALAIGRAPSRVTVIGGTHNPLAPPFEYLARSLAPQLAKIGWRITPSLDRYGFVPAGGGRIVVDIAPADRAAPLVLTERGALLAAQADVLIAHLPLSIAERQAQALMQGLPWVGVPQVTRVDAATSAGNMMGVTLAHANVTEFVSILGERGKKSEQLAAQLARAAKAWRDLPSAAPVGEYLCDQLLVPMAIAAGGELRAAVWSLHAESQRYVIAKFLGPAAGADRVRCDQVGEGAMACVQVSVAPRDAVA